MALPKVRTVAARAPVVPPPRALRAGAFDQRPGCVADTAGSPGVRPGVGRAGNVVCPLGDFGGRLIFAAADPEDLSIADKLRFILNRDVALVGAPREAVRASHQRELLRNSRASRRTPCCSEFTDTAIDFTETESTASIERSQF